MIHSSRRSIILAVVSFHLLLSEALCPIARAEDWPHWRGPTHNGISQEKNWQTDWPAEGPPIVWKTNVGLGFPSFAVAADRVYTTGHKDEQDTVFCFAADSGALLWKHSYPAELGDKYFEGGTTGTPAVEGEHLYSLSRWGDLFCFEAASGKVVWSKNIAREQNIPIPTWGFSGGPLVHGPVLVLNVGDAGYGLNKKTGEVIWKSASQESGYSTPLPVERQGEHVALIASAKSYVAVKIDDGAEVWRVRWITQYDVNAADPIVHEQKVFISTGYGKGAGLFDFNQTQSEPLWKTKALRTQMNPAVLHDGHLYGPDGDTTQNASFKCLEFATGKEKWSHAGFGSGAAIIADGKLIALSGKGELLVAPATPDGFKPLSRAQVLGGKCWTAPVLANGRIYCRNSRGDIVCVNVRKS